LTFDASLKQLFAPLLRGETVWLLPEEMTLQPQALLRALAEHPQAGINCVPSLWEILLDEIEANPAAFPADGLCGVYLGGETYNQALVKRSFAALPKLTLWNLYGPTEATANATAARLSPGDPITIGRPLANAQAYILDRELQPVPVGVPGELYIGGVGVARGYLNRSELTRQKFIANPFYKNDELGMMNDKQPDASGIRLNGHSSRLYRTGDLARYRMDGSIEFLGRADDQVKIRGFRIELGEIETLLNQHAAVERCVVVGREETRGDKRLVAYVVRRPLENGDE
jgi:amino acid adenylation domain-containing protein